MPAIAKVNPREFMKIIRQRLIKEVPYIDEKTSWFDDEPIPWGRDPVSHHGFEFPICPGDWKANEFQNAGSVCTIGIGMQFQVGFQQKINLNKPKNLSASLVEQDEKSALEILVHILSALMVDRSGATPVRWHPTNASNERVLTEDIQYLSTVSPRRQTDGVFYSYHTFVANFNLDL